MSLLEYMIKVSLALMLFYTLYRFVFAKFTFFLFNRFFILASFIASFLLPFIKFPVRTEQFRSLDYPLSIDWDQIMQVAAVSGKTGSVANVIQPLFIALLIYSIISAFRLFRGIRQYFRIRKSYSNGNIQYKKGIRLNVHPNVESPFTMFRTVYLDIPTYEQNNSPVILHEMIHARQLHSVDLLISEIICAFLWFNPFVFLFKKQMRDNHEFLADQAAHAGENDLLSYMQVLSSELTRKYDPAFASYFQSSTLKKRIIMLTNRKSKNSKKWLYLLMIPVIGMMAMAFQQPVELVTIDASTFQQISNSTQALPEVDGDDIPSRFPLDAKYKKSISADYGKMKDPFTKKERMHIGIDITAPIGTPIYATANGSIVKSELHEKYGHLIVIKHGESYATLFAHMEKRLVEVGDEVKIGQKIATNGSTGLSTGPHLHYEVRVDGENVDPADYY